MLFLIISMQIVASLGLMDTLDTDGFSYFNPFYLYKECNSINWIGAWSIAFFFNVSLFSVAIFYWLCKLFTIGRK